MSLQVESVCVCVCACVVRNNIRLLLQLDVGFNLRPKVYVRTTARRLYLLLPVARERASERVAHRLHVSESALFGVSFDKLVAAFVAVVAHPLQIVK